MKPLIVIIGETASGKSSLAMEIAEKFNGEIINADSWSVYKNFNIGTAKPSKEERDKIKHHLLDIAEPLNGFSAAIYKRAAMKCIEEINNKNKLPILVGGTGLYVDSVLYDYSFLPPAPKYIRDKYNRMELFELMKIINTEGFNTDNIDLNNKRRLIRLIENKGVRPCSNKIRPNILILGIEISIEELELNIKNRVKSMIEKGLEFEVFNLAKLYSWEIEPMKGIGYREFKNYFEGEQTLVETEALIIKDSLKLAKKQRTWFKRNNSTQWLNKKSNTIAIVTTFLNKLNK